MALKAFPRVKVRKDYNGKVVAIKKGDAANLLI